MSRIITYLYTIHKIRNIIRNTHYASRLTPHASPLTPHVSRITYDESPITNHQSPFSTLHPSTHQLYSVAASLILAKYDIVAHEGVEGGAEGGVVDAPAGGLLELVLWEPVFVGARVCRIVCCPLHLISLYSSPKSVVNGTL